MRFYIVKTLRF